MLTRPQLLKKFPAFYGSQRFISAFTRACHLSLSRARSIHSMPPTHISKIILFHCLGCTKGPVQFQGLCVWFIKCWSFYGEELLPLRPSPKLEHHPLSAVRDCLFNIFAATLHIWRLLLHPQPEDALCCCDWNPFITRISTSHLGNINTQIL